MAFIIENTVLIGYIDEKGVQDITIPDGVTKIESDIFNEQGYNYIHVFEKCKNVHSITIPESVNEIDPNEFYYLKNLEWIECRGEVSVKYDCVFPGCKKLAYIICNPNTPLQELPEKWKLQLSIGVTKYISDGHAVSEEARKAVTKYISSQDKKKELYKIGFSYPFFARFMIDENLLSEEQYDEMINYAQENKLAEVTTMLIEGKNRRFPGDTLLEREEKKLDQEIKHRQEMEDHTSTAYLESQWTWKKREDGSLMIWTYKGNDTEVYIPAVIGKNKVTAVRGKLFYANENNRNYWMELNINKIHFAEGITEITNEGGLLAAFKIPTFVYLPGSIASISRSAFVPYGSTSRNLTIYAPAGSYAEQYAKENNIPFVAE